MSRGVPQARGSTVGRHDLTYTIDSVVCSCGWWDGPYNAMPHWLKALGDWHRAYPAAQPRVNRKRGQRGTAA